MLNLANYPDDWQDHGKQTMKIALISPYPDITAFGLRTLSAYLKVNGHDTRLIFLPDPFGDHIVHGARRYPDAVLDDVAALCSDAGLIGISVMTNFFDNAVELTGRLKSRVHAPVVWGGVHATIRPEECLEHADMACIGDGEEAILELAEAISRNADPRNIPNMCLKINGKVIRNPLRPLPHDLDCYPPPDFSVSDSHVLCGSRVKTMTPDIMKQLLVDDPFARTIGLTGYQTMTGRGCPHRCTYCVNDVLKGLYPGQNYLRWRSPRHVIAELEEMKKQMPFIQFMRFGDDAFFARSLEGLKEFCALYKTRIGLPFTCLASPATVTGEKVDLLVDAGLIHVQMGLESGSDRTLELFNRKNFSRDVMMHAVGALHKHSEKMFPTVYDFILDTPGETDADKIENIRFIAGLPKPYRLQPFALVLSPGTRLYDKIAREGLIKDERREIYSKTFIKREPTYLNLLVIAAKNGRMPSWLLRFCVSRIMLLLFNNRAVRFIYAGLFRAVRNYRQCFK